MPNCIECGKKLADKDIRIDKERDETGEINYLATSYYCTKCDKFVNVKWETPKPMTIDFIKNKIEYMKCYIRDLELCIKQYKKELKRWEGILYAKRNKKNND